VKKILFLIILSISNWAYADLYVCSIVNVAGLNDNGYFVTHGWKGNYVKRQFTIDNESGSILNTTALKTRLSNGDKDNKPVVISTNKDDNSLKIFTHFKNDGTYALFQMNDFDKESIDKPYFYHTEIGMILSGTCKIK
jgi:hypothetical protein|tara:strand:- start:12166 stop:12579 length:414 start_codon:yes stop_codon:yes gene_type:complete